MIAARKQELSVERTGTTVSVPNHPIGRLMYYLSCVDNLVDFGLPSKVTDYGHTSLLTYDDENAILVFAAILSPDVFVENKVMVNSDELCPDGGNEFYKITNTRAAVAATREFVIGGKTVHTLEIMAFTMSWLRRNYIEPMEQYEKRIQAIADGNPDKYKHVHQSMKRHKKHKKHKKKDKGCTIF